MSGARGCEGGSAPPEPRLVWVGDVRGPEPWPLGFPGRGRDWTLGVTREICRSRSQKVPTNLSPRHFGGDKPWEDGTHFQKFVEDRCFPIPPAEYNEDPGKNTSAGCEGGTGEGRAGRTLDP